MKPIERISLYFAVALVAVGWMNRARAEDEVARKSGILDVRHISIRNAQGKVVLRLGAGENGGGQIEVLAKNGQTVVTLLARSDNDGEVRFFDEGGVLRSTMGANDDGGYANFYARTGELATYVGSDGAADTGYIAVLGKGKRKVIELSCHEKGALVKVTNSEGQRVVSLGAAPDTGTGVLVLSSEKGAPGVTLYTTGHGGQINVLNDQGKKAGFLGVSADPAGNGLWYVARKDGQRIVEAGATSAAGGYMSMRNSANKRVLFLGATTGKDSDDGVVEVSRRSGGLGVVLRGYSGGSSATVYDAGGKAKAQLR